VQSPVSPGDVIASKYAVERVLGQGGMGVVVAARHLALDERVALKLLPASDEPSDAVARRLKREARAAARLRSKHAVRVADIGQLDNGSPFIVMEYVEGCTLAEVLRQRGPLPPREAIDLLLQACDAIAEAHGLGIVHRDIKPSNLMLSRLPDGSPWVYVLDFGIAKIQGIGSGVKLTHTSAILGSPSYMSPEQLRDAHRVDARSDQWSLGVTLHELLSGSLPFQGASAAAVLASIAADAPIPVERACPGLPAGLGAVVARCLQKDPAARYPDLAALAVALEPFASEASGGAAGRIARVLQGRPDGELVVSHGDAGGDDRTQVSQGIETHTAPGNFPKVEASRFPARGVLALALPALGLGLWFLLRRADAPAASLPAASWGPGGQALSAGLSSAAGPSFLAGPASSVVLADPAASVVLAGPSGAASVVPSSPPAEPSVVASAAAGARPTAHASVPAPSSSAATRGAPTHDAAGSHPPVGTGKPAAPAPATNAPPAAPAGQLPEYGSRK
jgi:hypothetical protein